MTNAQKSDFKPEPSDEQRLKARIKAKKARELDAPIATEEYHASQQAALDRIPLLRAQRLEREAAEAAQKAGKA